MGVRSKREREMQTREQPGGRQDSFVWAARKEREQISVLIEVEAAVASG
jgi:hypothetical protein